MDFGGLGDTSRWGIVCLETIFFSSAVDILKSGWRELIRITLCHLVCPGCISYEMNGETMCMQTDLRESRIRRAIIRKRMRQPITACLKPLLECTNKYTTCNFLLERGIVYLSSLGSIRQSVFRQPEKLNEFLSLERSPAVIFTPHDSRALTCTGLNESVHACTGDSLRACKMRVSMLMVCSSILFQQELHRGSCNTHISRALSLFS